MLENSKVASVDTKSPDTENQPDYSRDERNNVSLTRMKK